jgi:hypothetical protein
VKPETWRLYQLRHKWLYALCLLGAILPAIQAQASEWSALTETKVLYTDNVFELSAARRLALAEDPSQSTVAPLKNPQDVVWRLLPMPSHLGDGIGPDRIFGEGGRVYLYRPQ